MEELKNRESIYDMLNEQIKKIETKDLRDDIDQNPITDIIEEQKVYFWVRLYLNDADPQLEAGDDIDIIYMNAESLETKFIVYGKKNSSRDMDDDIVNYDPEDDTRCLCLMIDEARIKRNSSDIPFIRTLFKTSPYYQDQVYRRRDLVFKNKRTGKEYEYYQVDF